MGENWFLHRGIKYNIFGLIPKTSYVTQTLNIKYRGTIEPRAILKHKQTLIFECLLTFKKMTILTGTIPLTDLFNISQKSVTVYNTKLSSRCNLTAQIVPVQDK